MQIQIRIGGDETVAMNEQQLAELNALLAKTPVVDRYADDKIQEKKRISLEATLTIKTRSYTVL